MPKLAKNLNPALWIYPLIFLVVVVLLTTAGMAYLRQVERAEINNARKDLQRIADLKTHDLMRWREMRLHLAETLSSNPALGRWLETLCRDPSNTVAQAETHAWMDRLREHYGFRDVLLLDAALQPRRALADWAVRLGTKERILLAEATRTATPQLSDFHTGSSVTNTHLDLAIPFWTKAQAAVSNLAPCAYLLVRVDPERQLYPQLEAWPVPSESGEVLLVRREDDSVIHLNRLRFCADKPLTVRHPIQETNSPVVQAVLGRTGLLKGVDYRGKEVLAAAKAVPASPWILIAKCDTAEVMRNMAVPRHITLISTAGAIALVGLLLAVLALVSRLYMLRHDQETEQEFRQLFDHVGEAIFLFQNGQIITVNQTACALYGYTHDELLRITPQELRAPGECPPEETWLGLVTKNLGHGLYETIHRRHDGSRLPVEINLHPATYRGQPAAVAAVRDITRRRQLAEQLQVAYEKSVGLEAAINRSPVVVVLRRDGLESPLEYISDNVYRWGYYAEELIGQPALLWIHPDDLLPITKEIQHYIARNIHAFMLSYRLLTREGEVRWIEDHTRLLCNAAGAIKQVQSLLIDVTSHRELELELQQAQKMETVGRLAGGIAHDFNNLLQVILGFAELLATDLPENAPHRRDVREIQTAAQRAKELTSRLLGFSRKQMIQPTVTDLNTLITDARAMLSRVLGEKVTLQMDPAKQLWLTKVDQNQMQQIILNLIVNARDAMPEGGRVVMATHNVFFEQDDVMQHAETRAGAFVCLSLSDTGAGMTAEVLTHLFEPFFTTKPTGQGTGLGLAMAYGIVKQHDGWIHVYSQVGQGTTFKIYLPAVIDVEVSPAPNPAPPPSPAPNKRILLVEDEDSVRNLASRILRTRGYNVVPTRNIAEAEAAWRSEPEPFDLVFSDVVLPDGNGLDLVNKIFDRSAGPAIVLASGYTDACTRWPIIQERGYSFLQKPYPKNELLRVIGEALTKK